VCLISPAFCLPCLHRRGEGINPEDALREGDALLESAYVSSMRAAQERQIELLGFSLLSSGVFRGSRSLEEVIPASLLSHILTPSPLRFCELLSLLSVDLSTLVSERFISLASPMTSSLLSSRSLRDRWPPLPLQYRSALALPMPFDSS
jgi:hypothetical protein